MCGGIGRGAALAVDIELLVLLGGRPPCGGGSPYGFEPALGPYGFGPMGGRGMYGGYCCDGALE